MSRVTTVIFDVFETLVSNSGEDWLATFARICQVQHLAIDHQQLWKEWKSREVNFRKGRVNLKAPEQSPPFKSYEQAWRECFEGTFKALHLPGDASQAARMAVENMARGKPFPDALEAVPLIQRRWRTGVFSNADDAYLLPLLNRQPWRFQAVLSSESARVYKPHPGAFHKVTERLGSTPEEAVYVGDNQFDDILGAKGVGMRAVWINRNGASLNPELPAPDHVVSSLTELPSILEKA